MMEPSKNARKPVFPSTGQPKLFSEGDTHLIEEMQKIGNVLNQRMELLENENLFVPSTDLKVIQKYAGSLRKKCEALEMKIKTSI